MHAMLKAAAAVVTGQAVEAPVATDQAEADGDGGRDDHGHLAASNATRTMYVYSVREPEVYKVLILSGSTTPYSLQWLFKYRESRTQSGRSNLTAMHTKWYTGN